MIEDIKDIEVTDDMVDAIEQHCYNTYPEKYNKYLYRNVLFSITNIAIQASSQIQELIAENKRLKSEILKILTQISILEDDRKWQPIETAPVNIPILTWGFNNHIEISTKDFEGVFLTDVYKRGEYSPTHWRPLPQPPKELK